MGHEDASAESSTDGFETWVAARGPALQRFAHLVTGSAHDAPDLVQEALVSAYPRSAGLTRDPAAAPRSDGVTPDLCPTQRKVR